MIRTPPIIGSPCAKPRQRRSPRRSRRNPLYQPSRKQSRRHCLGGGDYLLTVKFTTLGAGVQQLILNPIPGVNRMGLADKGADGTIKPLELIPEDVRFRHFGCITTPCAEPPSEERRSRRWACASGRSQTVRTATEQSISFTTELPESGVRFIKTFTLRQHEFHVGLTVRIERLPEAKANSPFRYQLAGARAADRGRVVHDCLPQHARRLGGQQGRGRARS